MLIAFLYSYIIKYRDNVNLRKVLYSLEVV
jgi:hypothetical protein